MLKLKWYYVERFLQFMKTLYDTHTCNIRLLVKANIRNGRKTNQMGFHKFKNLVNTSFHILLMITHAILGSFWPI